MSILSFFIFCLPESSLNSEGYIVVYLSVYLYYAVLPQNLYIHAKININKYII